MNKFTPGPWNTAKALNGKLFITTSHNIGMARKQVCEVIPDIDTGDYQANARLIAAAPEMLEACQRAFYAMLNLGNGLNWPSEIPQSYADVMNELKAVINKAKGIEQP